MRSLTILLINLYKTFISSPLKFIFGSGCRFIPTCSDFTRQAVQRYGVIKGGWLGVKRFVKCNPWGECGYDPVEVNSKHEARNPKQYLNPNI